MIPVLVCTVSIVSLCLLNNIISWKDYSVQLMLFGSNSEWRNSRITCGCSSWHCLKVSLKEVKLLHRLQ